MLEGTDNEDLQDEAPFDMNEFVADLLAEEEADSEESSDDEAATVEDGPDTSDYEDEEEGELSQDDEGATVEEEEVLEEDDAAEEEVIEPEAEAKVDPRDAEVEALKELVQSQNQQLIDILAQQVAISKQRQDHLQAPKSAEIRDEVAQLALFGGDEKAWNALSPEEKAAGTKFAKDYMQKVTRHAKNPEALYAEQIQMRVRAEIEAAMAPLLQDTHKQRGQEMLDRHAGDLIGEHRERLHEVFKTLPGSRSNSWSDLEASLKAAAQLVRNEVGKESLTQRERKVETSQRQKKANKDAARGKGRRGGRRPKKSKSPKWDPQTTDLAQFARNLQDKE